MLITTTLCQQYHDAQDSMPAPKGAEVTGVICCKGTPLHRHGKGRKHIGDVAVRHKAARAAQHAVPGNATPIICVVTPAAQQTDMFIIGTATEN